MVSKKQKHQTVFLASPLAVRCWRCKSRVWPVILCPLVILLLPLVMPVFRSQLPGVLVSPFNIVNTDVFQYFFQVQLEEGYRQKTVCLHFCIWSQGIKNIFECFIQIILYIYIHTHILERCQIYFWKIKFLTFEIPWSIQRLTAYLPGSFIKALGFTDLFGSGLGAN